MNNHITPNRASYGSKQVSAFSGNIKDLRKQQHNELQQRAQYLSSLSTYPPDTSKYPAYSTHNSVTNVASNHPYGLEMTRSTTNQLGIVNNLSVSRKSAELMLSSLRESRHRAQHPAMLQEITQAIQSRDPKKLANLCNNRGFLTMCLHDNNLLQNFRSLLHETIQNSNINSNQGHISQMQSFINQSPDNLTNTLQQANKDFYQNDIKHKINQQVGKEVAASMIYSGVSAIPIIGGAAVAGAKFGNITHNETMNKPLSFGVAASTALPTLPHAIGLEVGTHTAPAAAGAILELSSNAIMGVGSAVTLGLGLGGAAAYGVGARKNYYQADGQYLSNLNKKQY